MKCSTALHMYSPVEQIEQSNYAVKFNGVMGVAAPVVDDYDCVEGVLIWCPSARLTDFKQA